VDGRLIITASASWNRSTITAAETDHVQVKAMRKVPGSFMQKEDEKAAVYHSSGRQVASFICAKLHFDLSYVRQEIQ